MITPTAINKAGSKDVHMRVTWILIAGLFTLRIPLTTITHIFSDSLSSNANWVDPIYQIGTYLLGAALIWWERDRLVDFHIDQLVLIIFIIGKPLELLMYQLGVPFQYSSGLTPYFLYIPIALSLAVALLVTRPSLPKLNARLAGWLVIGILAGIALGVYFGNIVRVHFAQSSSGPVTPMLLIFLPLQQMLYAGITEEPFFRGFLWGALHKAGVKNIWVWLIQAGLFWIGHAYYLARNAAWSFFFIVPVGGLILGLLAWRSHSIAVSMMAHGLANGIGQIVGYY